MANKETGRFDGKPGPGRKKGIPNKSTTFAREAIARLVDGNADRLQGWLDAIAEIEGPLAAWKCLQDVMEYHIPKLARTEHVGDGGGPIRVQAVEWTVVNPAGEDPT